MEGGEAYDAVSTSILDANFVQDHEM